MESWLALSSIYQLRKAYLFLTPIDWSFKKNDFRLSGKTSINATPEARIILLDNSRKKLEKLIAEALDEGIPTESDDDTEDIPDHEFFKRNQSAVFFDGKVKISE